MAGKGGGAWKVAYADFVTAMMAFFMVMWLTSQKQEVREAVAHHFREANHTSFIMPIRDGHPASGKHKGHGAPASRGHESHRPRFQLQQNRDRSSVGTVILFRGESGELDERGREQLSRLVPQIAGLPQKIEIRGHTSRKPLSEQSPFADAWQLSFARCEAITEFLVAHGIEPRRLRLSQAAGYEPLSNLTDPKSLEQNTRVEVFLIGELVDSRLETSDSTSDGGTSPDDHGESAASSDGHGDDSHGGKNHGENSQGGNSHDAGGHGKNSLGTNGHEKSSHDTSHEPAAHDNSHDAHAPAAASGHHN